MELFSGMCSACSAKVSERYFEVNNYGFLRELDKAVVTRRPQGRPDYQLIYVSRGTVLCEDGDGREISEGKLLLYRPGQPQIYRYEQGEESEYLWFHFSGTGCEELLWDLFGEREVTDVGNAHEIHEALGDLCAHVTGDDPLSKEYACGRMIVMLAALKQRGAHRDRAMERVLAVLRRERFHEGSNRAYAEIADMSESHFLRRFAAYTGTTPHKYKIRLLLRQAAELLQDTEMNVGEVAYAIGIEDSLYFSRLIKKEYGVSPMGIRSRR